MARSRVVLDTNVLVSGLAYPSSIPGKILAAWRQGKLDVVLSRHILEELVRVLPRLSRVTLTAGEIQDLADSLMFLADIVDPVADHDDRLRDPADQAILQTFMAGAADYLITGDKDLLVLADAYPIVAPAWFWQKHGQ